MAWPSTTFEVMSGGSIDVGLDGEALEMESPLVFSMRPEPLRVRIPRHAIGYSPAAMAMDWRSAAKNLGRIAAGRPVTTCSRDRSSVERTTGFEPATPTLARWCSTN